MSHHKKYWYGLAAVAFAVSAVNAAPPLAVSPVGTGPKSVSDEPVVRGGEMPLTGSFTAVYCSGFESTDGWDLSSSICGTEFDTCVGNSPASLACNPKDHLGNGNCCDKDPNVDTGWMMNGLARHCDQPHIDNVHPSPLKSPSTQHLRMQFDPAGGAPPGCTGFGAACRQRWSAPWDRNQPEINKTTWKYDISYSHDFIGTSTRVRNFFGNLVNGGGIFVHAYLYFHSNGYVYARISNPATLLGAVGKWSYDAPNYAQVTVEYDPCNDRICYTYAGVPNPLFPTGSRKICTPFGFSPPYGSYCNYSGANCGLGGFDPNPPYLDSMTWSQSHFNDGQRIDMDNFCITHTPCPDACCYNDGTCVEGLSQTECETPKGKYYPNVACAQLGTPGYPPACTEAKGSCCNSGPRLGGACTDGVIESACVGAQLTWTKGASCDGYATLCKSAELQGGNSGMCNSGPGLDPTKPPNHCITDPTTPCLTNADCAQPGFCYGGLCTPASIPGHCEYLSPLSAGYCANASPPAQMGQCQNGPDCVPLTGVGCCDPNCPTIPAATCPGATGPCIVEKQGCNAIPGGADCAFCEGCIGFPVVGCSNIGVPGGCPAPVGHPDVGPGTCVANSLFVCNGDADCPTPESGGVCIFPPVSPGGIICTRDDQCVIPATTCEEHTGACCNYVKGTCRNDVLDADCKDPQDTWFKLTLCADLEAAGGCDAHLGACCDEDTFGGCEQTTENECAALKKGVFHKLQDCADIVCVHKAIPTVSEWGIAVLTLLLLIGAKVYFGRRQAATA